MIGIGQHLSLAMQSGRPAGGYVGPLDELVGPDAWMVQRAYSTRQLFTTVACPSCQLRGNGSGSPVADIGFRNGAADQDAVAALISTGGGTAAYWSRFYDQSQNGYDATQTSTANQVPYDASIFSSGALGGCGSAANCWINLGGQGGIDAVFYLFMVVNVVDVSTSRYLCTVSSNSRHVKIQNDSLTQNWGTALSAAPVSTWAGKSHVLIAADGTLSRTYDNGTLVATGNAGTGGIAARFGSYSALNNFFTPAGHAMAEIILFSQDPTTMPGWTDFLARTRAFFGTK